MAFQLDRDGQALRAGVARSRSMHESMATGHKTGIRELLIFYEELLYISNGYLCTLSFLMTELFYQLPVHTNKLTPSSP
jgi:hypothetical protein